MTTPGTFIWHELMTSDLAGAETFYRNVIGWDVTSSGMDDYRLVLNKGERIAGMLALPEEAAASGARPGWLGYIAVDDVDAMAHKITGAGGRLHRQPTDVPGAGRFAMVSDPHGAAFYLFRGQGTAPPAAMDEPGRIGWHELHSAKLEESVAFYSDMFGWERGESHDMGPIGRYQIMKHDGKDFCGMMTKTPETPAPFWTYYVTVDGIDGAVSRIRDNGGAIVMEPHEVPGGAWIALASDPQGALLPLSAARR